MTIYYVDETGGDDGNNGTSELTAWETQDKADDGPYNAGDSILNKKGEEWREQHTAPSAGSDGSPITISTYGTGADPIFNGADLVATWEVDAGNVWKATFTTEPTQVFFDGTKGTKEDAKGNLNAADEWFWDSNVLYVYSTSDPDTAYTSPGIEASIRNFCIYWDSKDYITVDGIECRYAADQGLKVLSSSYFILTNVTAQYAYGNGILISVSTNGLIQTCTTHHNGDVPVAESIGAGVLCTDNASADNIIDGVTSYSNMEDGVAVGGSPGAYPNGIHTIKNCTLYNNAEDGIDIKGDAANIIESNTIYGNTEKGIHILEDAETVTIRYNMIRDNTGYGIYLSAGSTHEIYYNVIANNSQYGIETHLAGPAHEIYNNVFYKNGAWQELRIRVEDMIVRNNIFYSDGYECIREDQTPNITNLTMDNNSFYRVQEASDVVYVNDVGYTMADVTGGGYFAGSGHGEHSIAGDPLFTDADSNVFTLQATSPCRDAGVYVGLDQDYASVPVPQGSAPDIGANEYLFGDGLVIGRNMDSWKTLGRHKIQSL